MINPLYSGKTSTSPLIPYFKSITLYNVDAVLGSQPDGPITPIVTLESYDATHPTNVTLNNVLIQGIVAANVLTDANTVVTLGSQGANFAVGTHAAGNPPGIACDWGWPVPTPN
jgi:hypothetical protein